MSTSTERMRLKRERDKGIEEARALGRRYGEHECERLAACGSPQVDKAGRIARAERYSVWRYEESL